MFSDPPILRDFVYPIPYCQSQTNLDSILNVFHRWNCQQIAIYQKDGTWGIIESTDLLSLISEVYLERSIVAQGRSRNRSYQQTLLGLNNQSLSLIVKPAMVYELGTSLDKFLSLLPKGSLSSDRH